MTTTGRADGGPVESLPDVASANLATGRVARTVESATRKVSALLGREIVPVLW